VSPKIPSSKFLDIRLVYPKIVMGNFRIFFFDNKNVNFNIVMSVNSTFIEILFSAVCVS
jgi:hypothetical protein